MAYFDIHVADTREWEGISHWQPLPEPPAKPKTKGEEIATEIVAKCSHIDDCNDRRVDCSACMLEHHVAAAIDKAIAEAKAEEREACADIADKRGECGWTPNDCVKCCRTIGEGIRARANE